MKMMTSVKNILSKLEIEDTGRYDNHFYIIKLKDSDDYARMYTKLNKNAINTEFPNFGTNTNKSTVKVTNYFEIDDEDTTYNIFLVADFDKDSYYVKIGEK